MVNTILTAPQVLEAYARASPPRVDDILALLTQREEMAAATVAAGRYAHIRVRLKVLGNLQTMHD